MLIFQIIWWWSNNDIIELNPYELTIFDNSYSSILITTPYLEKGHPKILYVKNIIYIITPPPNNLKNQQAYLTLGC